MSHDFRGTPLLIGRSVRETAFSHDKDGCLALASTSTFERAVFLSLRRLGGEEPFVYLHISMKIIACVTLAHHVTKLVHHFPYGLVTLAPQLALDFLGGYGTSGRRQKVHGGEPVADGQVASLHHSTGTQGHLMLTVHAGPRTVARIPTQTQTAAAATEKTVAFTETTESLLAGAFVRILTVEVKQIHCVSFQLFYRECLQILFLCLHWHLIACLNFANLDVCGHSYYFNIEIEHLGLWAKFSKIWTRIIYPYSHKIIAVSDGIYKYLIYDLKQKPTKIIKVPNPINVKEINVKSKKKCEFNLPDNYIVFIGRLGAVKNIYMLLDAYEKARLNECYLVIVGDGVDMMSLQKYAIKLSKKKRIIFTGATNNPLPVLRNAKSLVLPSFSEAFPTVLLEAICLGVPVVATPTEGAKEILNNLPNAYISNSFTDSDEFAKLLEQAYCQPKIDLSSYLKIYDEKVICASLINSCI